MGQCNLHLSSIRIWILYTYGSIRIVGHCTLHLCSIWIWVLHTCDSTRLVCHSSPLNYLGWLVYFMLMLDLYSGEARFFDYDSLLYKLSYRLFTDSNLEYVIFLISALLRTWYLSWYITDNTSFRKLFYPFRPDEDVINISDEVCNIPVTSSVYKTRCFCIIHMHTFVPSLFCSSH